MKKAYFFIVVLGFCSTVSMAQSWVWGKRGGGSGNTVETIQSMAIDSHNNIYATAMVSAYNIDIDGHTLNSTDMGQNMIPTDAVLTSFACDGSYRWSKIFTGQDHEVLKYVHTDAQDNVYVTGFAGGGGGSLTFFKYPNYLDSDVTFDQTTTVQDYCIAFIVKYNSNGIMQWLKRIRPPYPSITTDNQVSITGYTLDSNGNSFLLASLSPDSYFDGALTVTGTGYKNYVLKFDTNGNYTGATYLDFQSTYGSGITFYRNPYNGNYYLTSNKGDVNDIATFGGQNVSTDAVLACFDSAGQFQWVRTDVTTGAYGDCIIVNMTFDINNDVYLVLRLTSGSTIDSFLGYSIAEATAPITIMKTNPNVDTVIWASRSTTFINANPTGGVAINNNEIAISNFSGNGFTWGTQTSVATPGATPLLARLNKTTGECIGLSNINNNNQLNDNGDFLMLDNNGDYIIGGQFHSILYFDTNQQILNNGPQTDFFIAKYSTSVCSLSTADFKEQGLELYPNPVENTVRVTTTEDLDYSLYTITGKLIKQGKITEQENTIDFAQLSTGTYILETTNCNGEVKKVKLLKK